MSASPLILNYNDGEYLPPSQQQMQMQQQQQQQQIQQQQQQQGRFPSSSGIAMDNRSSPHQQQRQQHSHSLASLSSSSFTSSIMESPHSMAQQLNNRASYLITIGKYQQGINLLTKALKLADQQTQNCNSTQDGSSHQANEASFQATLPSCNCKFCSLESCLLMDYDSLMSYVNEDDRHNHNHHHNHHLESQEEEDKHCYSHHQQQQDGQTPLQGSSSSTYSKKHKTEDTHTHTHHDGVGFVYQQPLLVNKKCIEERHDMGGILSLIILFNLALAYHLKATVAICVHGGSHSHKKNAHEPQQHLQVLQQALQLYELAYQLHVSYIQQQSQLQSHTNCNDDRDNHQQDNGYYDDDDDMGNNDNNNNNSNMGNNHTDTATANTNDYNRSIGSLRFTMIVSNNLGEIHRLAGNQHKHKLCQHHLLSAIMYMVDSNNVHAPVGTSGGNSTLSMESPEMDGFYDNILPLILTDICAKTA